MFEFFAFTFFKRFESLFEVICPIQSVSWAWIPMPAFGQGPLKQGRSGRSNFIAGFVQPKQSVDGGFLAFTIDLGVDDDELKEIKKCRID